MKLILDQGLPRSTVQHLAAVGISAEHVGDLGLAAAADDVILDAARQRQAVVVALDADFHQFWPPRVQRRHQWCAFALKV